MKWLKWSVLVAVIGLLGWWAWQRLFVTDAQRIQRLIATMTRAVEQGNIWRLEGAIANDYRDDSGLDKSSLLAAVRAYRQQNAALFIHIADLQITVAPDHQRAEAVFIAKVLATPRGGVAQTELLADRFRLLFRQADQGWVLFRAESPELKFE